MIIRIIMIIISDAASDHHHHSSHHHHDGHRHLFLVLGNISKGTLDSIGDAEDATMVVIITSGR